MKGSPASLEKLLVVDGEQSLHSCVQSYGSHYSERRTQSLACRLGLLQGQLLLLLLRCSFTCTTLTLRAKPLIVYCFLLYLTFGPIISYLLTLIIHRTHLFITHDSVVIAFVEFGRMHDQTAVTTYSVRTFETCAYQQIGELETLRIECRSQVQSEQSEVKDKCERQVSARWKELLGSFESTGNIFNPQVFIG